MSKIFLDGDGWHEVIELPELEKRPCKDCETTISYGNRCDDCAIKWAIERGVIDEGPENVAVRTIGGGRG